MDLPHDCAANSSKNRMIRWTKHLPPVAEADSRQLIADSFYKEIGMDESLPAPRGMKTFLIIWLGELVSMIGSGLTSFALGVWIFRETRQATPFTITMLFNTIPRILLSPLAGSIADRWSRRWVMILADTGNALVTLCAAILLLTGNLEIWHIYLIALFNSSFAAFQEPAYTASITMLVPKKDLARASGLMQMGQAVEMLISPVLAGALFGAIGLNGIMFIDFATFFFAIAALVVVRIPQPKLAQEEKRSGNLVWHDARLGWNYLTSRPGLIGLLSYFALVNFLLNFAVVLQGPLVLSMASAGVFGLVQTVSGVGMLAGSIAMSAWGGPKRRMPALIGLILLLALSLLVIGGWPSPIFVAAGLSIMMFFAPMASGLSQALFQSKVEPSVQGRVFAIRGMIARSMIPLAFLISGPLADLIFEPWVQREGAAQGFVRSIIGSGPGRGIGLMFVLSGLTLILASFLAFINQRIWRLEEELPDALPSAEDEAPVEPKSLDIEPA
ncbi:MAG: MFS transporter [Chloroflexota bacterium]|nr:MAG: MFS transporter [Chloroflexota bacterium]